MGRRKRKVEKDEEGKVVKKKRDDRDNPYKKTVTFSERFAAYYKELGIVPEGEWDSFITAFQTPLPVTFRVTQGTMFSEGIQQMLENKFLNTEKKILSQEGVELQPPKPLEWYPNNGAWYFNTSRRDLRKSPDLEKFHKFLIAQTEYGNIARQEAVSMVPPLFLDVQPHHRVLDMCAAPGSKTMQMVGFMHSNDKTGIPPTGVIIANDLDVDRGFLLCHQLKRLGSPCAIIVNHEAQNYPFIKIDPSQQEATIEGKNKEGKITYQFDRILCDVPCSGDGTLRKSPDLWTRWNPQMGTGIHKLQVTISTRGVHLLKVGGRMVYSTCSLNPSEDEASVAELLRRFKGSLRLVDVSKEFTALKRSNGISSWKVSSRGTWYSKFEDVPPTDKSKLVPSLFPPTEEEAKEFHLERCMRILPHVQDTGGFFIALLEKTAPTEHFKPAAKNQQANEKEEKEGEKDGKEEEVMKEAEEAVKTADDAAPKDDDKKKKRLSSDPFNPLPESLTPTWQNIKETFGIKDDFPFNQLMTRSEKTNSIYFFSTGTYSLFKADKNRKIKIVNTGVKMFAKHDSKIPTCPYRLCQEGLKWILPYLTKRIITINEYDFKVLLKGGDPLINTFSESTQVELKALSEGSLAWKLSADSKLFPGLTVCGWRGKVSAKLHIKKRDVEAYTMLLSEDNFSTDAKTDVNPEAQQVAAAPASIPTVESKKGLE